LDGVLPPPNLNSAKRTCRTANALQRGCETRASRLLSATGPNIFASPPTSRLSTLHPCPQHEIFKSLVAENPRALHCYLPISFANVSSAGPSCLTIRALLPWKRNLILRARTTFKVPAWQEAYAKDCLTRARRVLDLVPPASSTKLCTRDFLFGCGM
jgi:hypothetical protein